MTQRERLIEILSRYFQIGDSYAYNLTRDKQAFSVGTMHLDDFEEFDENTVADIADHILANGVIVPPCKVGDTVYVLDDIIWAYECKGCPYFEEGWYDDPHECRKTNDGRKHHDCIEIKEHIVTQDDIYSYLQRSLFGKTVFFTREEAEKALAERNGK